MTYPTDEELDALVERLQNVSLQVGFPSRTILDSHVIRQSAEAITALRSQLAEVQAELVSRVDMHECAMAERDDATLYSDEQKARADRAEQRVAALEAAPVTLADALQVPRIVTFHTAGRFGVCIGGMWDGWVMVQHPDGYWVSHHKPDPVDPSIPALRAIGEGEA